MKEQYLQTALTKVEDPRLLINGAAVRAKELARGGRPLIAISPGESVEWLDIALREIAEEKIQILPAS